MTELTEKIARIAEAVSPYLSRHFIDLDDYRVLPAATSPVGANSGRPPLRPFVRMGTVGLTVLLAVIATAVPADITSGALENETLTSARAADDRARPADGRAWIEIMGEYQRLFAQQNRAAQNQEADALLLSRLIVWMDKSER